jgi:purine catabolism regulator
MIGSSKGGCAVVTLSQLISSVEPALVPLTAARQPTPLSGIHISELADPTPYLEGGELLLTTGMAFADSPGTIPAYVDRLRERGVAALALGLGPAIDEVPDELAEHCAELAFPLLTVPPDEAFIRVTRGFWELVAASDRAGLVAQLGTQTAIVREAAKPDGATRIASLVAQALGGWTAYVPLYEAEAVVWPATLGGVLANLRVEVQRFAEGGNVGAATFPLHGYDVIAHPVGAGAVVRGAFAVGVGRRLSSPDRQLILTATAALSLWERARLEADAARHSIRESIAMLVLYGEFAAAEVLATVSGEPPLPATIRIFASPEGPGASGDPARADGALDELVARGHLSAAAAERSRPLRSVALDGMRVLLLAGPLPNDGPAASTIDDGELSGALGDATRPLDAAAALARVLRRARAAGRGEIVTSDETAGLSAGAEAAARLAAYSRAPLIETARSFLRNRGSWEAAARDLGVHRNTIRNRIRIIHDELAIDLEDPDLSAELWLALRDRFPTH